jgi:hypothetical protein
MSVAVGYVIFSTDPKLEAVTVCPTEQFLSPLYIPVHKILS